MHIQPLEFIESLAIQPDYVFKILVVGNSYVGKSSFLMRLCTNSFSQRYASTIGESCVASYIHHFNGRVCDDGHSLSPLYAHTV